MNHWIRPLAIVSCMLLASCGSAPASSAPPATGGTTIAGVLYAPSGGDVAGAVVLACPYIDGACDEARLSVTPVAGSGESAPFETAELSPGNYVVIGWRDVNRNEDVDAGDLLGAYATGGEEATEIAPPARGIPVRMHVLAATPAPTVPSELAGIWRNGGITTDGFYDPDTDAWADPVGSGAAFEFTTDGRYVHVTLMRHGFGHCVTSYFTYQEGTVESGGGELALAPARARSKREYSCTPEEVDEDSTLPAPGRYAWRLASDGGETVLQLYDLESEGAGWSTFYR